MFFCQVRELSFVCKKHGGAITGGERILGVSVLVGKKRHRKWLRLVWAGQRCCISHALSYACRGGLILLVFYRLVTIGSVNSTPCLVMFMYSTQNRAVTDQEITKSSFVPWYNHLGNNHIYFSSCWWQKSYLMFRAHLRALERRGWNGRRWIIIFEL